MKRLVAFVIGLMLIAGPASAVTHVEFDSVSVGQTRHHVEKVFDSHGKLVYDYFGQFGGEHIGKSYGPHVTVDYIKHYHDKHFRVVDKSWS